MQLCLLQMRDNEDLGHRAVRGNTGDPFTNIRRAARYTNIRAPIELT